MAVDPLSHIERMPQPAREGLRTPPSERSPRPRPVGPAQEDRWERSAPEQPSEHGDDKAEDRAGEDESRQNDEAGREPDSCLEKRGRTRGSAPPTFDRRA